MLINVLWSLGAEILEVIDAIVLTCLDVPAPLNPVKSLITPLSSLTKLTFKGSVSFSIA